MADTGGTRPFGSHQIVDVQHPDPAGVVDDAPAGRAHAGALVVIGGAEPQPLRVPLLIHLPEEVLGEVRAEFTQYGKQVGGQSGIAGFEIEDLHAGTVGTRGESPRRHTPPDDILTG